MENKVTLQEVETKIGDTMPIENKQLNKENIELRKENQDLRSKINFLKTTHKNFIDKF